MADKLEPSQKAIFISQNFLLLVAKNLRFQGVKIWNSLPIEKRKQFFKNFKDNLKNKLLESY